MASTVVVVAKNANLPGVLIEVRDEDTGKLRDFATAVDIAFSRRPVASATADLVNRPATSPGLGLLQYAPWTVGETANPGEYAGWFTVTWPGPSLEEFGEVVVDITDHAPDPVLAAPSGGPCTPWVTTAEVTDLCGASDADQWTTAALAASDVLFNLSGRQYAGLCTSTVRPCANSNPCGWWLGARWRASACGCGPLSEVWLPGYPVRAITSVTINGVAVDPATYRLDLQDRLVRLSGSDPWPSCQDLSVGPAAVGSFVVAYTHGADPPASGVLAAQALACQLVTSLNGGECAIPAGATKITRQGVTIDKAAVASAIGQGATGVVAIDAFLAGHNPTRLRRRPAVWSPDLPRYARRT